MGWLARMLGRQSAATSFDMVSTTDPFGARIFSYGKAKAGVTVNVETVLGVPAVLRGVNIISNAMMKVRPAIYKRVGDSEDKVRDKSHPSWEFVNRRAHELMSAGYFRKTLTNFALLRGNGVGYLVRDEMGRIVSSIPLLPDRTGMAIDGDRVFYWTTVGGEVRKFPPADVIHIKGISHNGFWGIDIVDALAESFGLSIAPRNFSAQFYANGANPTGIVYAPANLKPAEQKDFAKRVADANQGLGKAHRLMVLEETAKFQQMSLDPEKSQMIATREFERVEIANIIGIQSHKIGDSSRASYNSLEQSNQEHLDDDLDPWLQMWEDELEAKCLSDDEKSSDSHLIEFNRKALVRVNLAARTARHQFERQNGISTANDILRQENQRPIGEVGDTYMVPANMTLLSKDGLPILRGQAAPEAPPRQQPEE